MIQNSDQPIPQGTYVPAARHADLIYTSGMTPRKTGKLLYSGRISASDPPESHRDAVCLATFNALLAARACLQDGEKLSVILRLTVFINAEPEFTAHSKIADYASETLIEHLGPGSIGSRAAVGVASLPANAPVEITLIGSVASQVSRD
ncbi:RidA family protein [Desulfofustis glycolicus]|uniref:Enamine deaminase RidA, house cleaning of reactive enamine intermediates, YjgF/YER057c/UK114 family n=1 Tax=Desulfofustis glycolicus DSM 9705 TaxID=1121409 RepID=A0A1M5YIP6_9BACT|nr:RidA family protein [Desulfofustis glycolicus]MCB2218576.1 RidA family protein [Desulfobulbaceae bacterium]SHI11886.1 Enamine deaminase RidA, house cleaning of reactive enamine intermediates, YjgF/YER057c/UK114 family [Desulfofustis glycolicus DSM 9705]